MNFISTMSSFDSALPPLELTGWGDVVGLLLLVLFCSWLICVSAAFCKVERVQLTVGLLAIGISMVAGVLLSAFVKTTLPEVALSLTPEGLFLLTTAAGALVCSVPLVQLTWHISYSRGVMVLCGAVVIFFASLATYHSLLHSPRTLPERLSIRILSN
jgi:hypothetical protein